MHTYIHIGQHKTATTSIQAYLNNHAALLQEQGCYYPRYLGFSRANSHYPLSICAIDQQRSTSMMDKLAISRSAILRKLWQRQTQRHIKQHYQQAQQLGCTRMLWSSEGLYLLNSKAEYQRLINLFAAYSSKITFVCCFRELDGFRHAYRKQLKKQKLSEILAPNSYRYVKADSWLFDYSRKKALLESSGSEVIYLDYQAAGMVSHFLTRLQLPATAAEEYQLNKTL